MLGAIAIVIFLLVVFPVSVMMSMGGLAALLGTVAKNSVDNEHEDTELLTISETNYYVADAEAS